jgi:hypothetical protein
MAEALLGAQALVARLDDDLGALVVTGRSAGPAGAASVVLGEIEVDLDAADPGELVDLTVPLPPSGEVGTSAAHLLEALLGADRAGTIVRLAARGGAGTIRLAGPPSRGRYGTQPVGGVVAPLQRLALASAHLGRRHLSPFDHGVALLTMAVESAHLGLVSTARQQAADGAVLVLDGLPPDADRLAPAAGEALVQLFDDVGRLGLLPDTAAGPLGRLADRFRPGHEARAGGGALYSRTADQLPAAMMEVDFLAMPARARAPKVAAAMAPATSLRARLTVGAESLAGGPTPTARWLDDGNIVVELPPWGGDSSGLWARAFRPGTDTLVAAAPVQVTGTTRAVLLVPPHLALDVDVVTDPRAPRPSRALAASMVGFAHGWVAALNERLHVPNRAADEWRACSAAHAEAGDGTRSAAARARAAARRYDRSPATPAIASDHLAALSSS